MTRTSAVERAAYIVGAGLLTSGMVHLAIQIVSGGSWDGPLSLRKPTTFGLSFGLTVVTIVWVSSFLQLGARMRATLLGAFAAVSVLETALVALQAWRGVPSHFNVETPLDASVTRLLAAGGITLIALIVVLTIVAFRRQPTLPVSQRLAIRVGLLTLCGSLAVGAVMIARGMTLVFAGRPQAAYLTGGALKPMHAVLMHGILVLPLFAWLLSRTDWPEGRRLTATRLAAAAYLMLAALVAAVNIARL